MLHEAEVLSFLKQINKELNEAVTQKEQFQVLEYFNKVVDTLFEKSKSNNCFEFLYNVIYKQTKLIAENQSIGIHKAFDAHIQLILFESITYFEDFCYFGKTFFAAAKKRNFQPFMMPKIAKLAHKLSYIQKHALEYKASNLALFNECYLLFYPDIMQAMKELPSDMVVLTKEGKSGKFINVSMQIILEEFRSCFFFLCLGKS